MFQRRQRSQIFYISCRTPVDNVAKFGLVEFYYFQTDYAAYLTSFSFGYRSIAFAASFPGTLKSWTSVFHFCTFFLMKRYQRETIWIQNWIVDNDWEGGTSGPYQFLGEGKGTRWNYELLRNFLFILQSRRINCVSRLSQGPFVPLPSVSLWSSCRTT